MNLDKLLADAMRSAYKTKASHPLAPKVPRYAPCNWRPARQIELIWQDTASSQPQSLGTYRELVHDQSGGRRLAKMDSPSESEELYFEFCYGEHWVNSRKPVARALSEEDRAELQERFQELISDYAP